ncbi:hypothetical protein BDV12DRAFT_176667 [Aspergillus spectabilis]
MGNVHGTDDISPTTLFRFNKYRLNVLHPEKIPSAIERYKNKVQRVLSVFNKALQRKPGSSATSEPLLI